MAKGLLTFQNVTDRGYDDLFVSVVAYMEVFGYRDLGGEEELALKELLKQTPILQTDMEIANYVVAYRRQRRIKLPDAIILATARTLGADLMTKNTDDFRGIDEAVRLVEPF
jgi:hypothetical protein